MWTYEKRLQFPVNIKETNAQIAQVILTQYGGPDGELGASMRYLSQRYTMPYPEVAALLTDIGTGISILFSSLSTLFSIAPLAFQGHNSTYAVAILNAHLYGRGYELPFCLKCFDKTLRHGLILLSFALVHH